MLRHVVDTGFTACLKGLTASESASEAVAARSAASCCRHHQQLSSHGRRTSRHLLTSRGCMLAYHPLMIPSNVLLSVRHQLAAPSRQDQVGILLHCSRY
jgi:hypothetical protein